MQRKDIAAFHAAEHLSAADLLRIFDQIVLGVTGVTQLDLQLVDFVQRKICVAEIQLTAIIELQISTA